MRGVLLYYNGLAAIVALAFFGYTLVGQAHIERTARDFVVTKTVEHATPLVTTAAEVVEKNRFVRALLTHDQETAVRREIADYRRDPRAYVVKLVDDPSVRTTVSSATSATSASAVAAWKRRAAEHYDHVFAGLLRDLRIFAATNVVAALVAVWLALRADDQVSDRLLVASGALLVSIVVSSLAYFDDLTFFKMITNSYTLAGYPIALVGIFLWIYDGVRRSDLSSVKPVESRPAMAA